MVADFTRPNNELICGIVLLNLMGRAREIGVNLKLYTIKIFRRNATASKSLLNPDGVIYEHGFNKRAHQNIFLLKNDWTVTTRTLMLSMLV